MATTIRENHPEGWIKIEYESGFWLVEVFRIKDNQHISRGYVSQTAALVWAKRFLLGGF